ncbi:DUF6887 family protein [Microcoleus sp. OTE_8_concoct_300]|uniref:DUF6887 family protein n=1 Tax=Microcoleus sp. OTE_8_concoct_300 TaxID=2964710 RepID=UPI00403F41CD
MKPNFEEMSKAELKAYVLSHRDDDEAIRVFFGRRNPPDSEATWYGPMCTPEGLPIEENIRIAEEAIRQKVDRDREKSRAKELEAKSVSTIEEGWVNSKESKMTVVTQTEIEQVREQLIKNYPEALPNLDTIQECEGNLEDAAQVIVLEAGEEEVQSDLLEKLSSLCRSVICKEDMKEELPVLIAAITEFLASGSGFPPGLATPIAIFVTKRGMKNFCQSTDSNSNSQ